MYRLMRNIHLILGLASLLFVAAYLVSSVRFAHNRLFGGQNLTTSESTIAVDPALAAQPRELAAWLMDEHSMKGDLMRVQKRENGAYSMIIRRLGTRYVVERSEGAKELKVVTQRQGFWGILVGMHIGHGVWHDYWLHKVWGTLAFVTSLALLLMGASGIYLWFKTYEERWIGAILLVIGSAWGIGSALLVRSMG